MSALAYTSTPETIVGYRFWRVMPFRRLNGTHSYRLCAMGTNGVPKVWEPRRPNVAVCSAYESDHEAPWPDHECGLWALDDLERARKRLTNWISNYTCGDPVGVAIGQVSLWGRVIEHEHGYRGQFAYPYSLTISTPDEDAARVIRREYAVDVEWVGGDLYERSVAKRVRRAELAAAKEAKRQRELAEIQDRLRKISEEMSRSWEERQAEAAAKQEAERAAERAEREASIAALPPVSDLADITADEAVLAVLVAIESENHQNRSSEWAHLRERVELHPWDRSEIVNAALRGRGEAQSFNIKLRRGVREATRSVSRALKAARDEGLLEYGLPYEERHSHRGGGSWFLTAAALQKACRHRGPLRVVGCGGWNPKMQEWDSVELDLKFAARELRKRQRPLFVDEVDELLPGWRDERRAVQKRGKRAYAAWLTETRESGHFMQLTFDDGEVVEAVLSLTGKTGGAVPTVAILEHLAPGERTRNETPRNSQQLVRLARAGRLVRSEIGGKPHWAVAAG